MSEFPPPPPPAPPLVGATVTFIGAIRQLRARRALKQLKDVTLRTRRGLSLYKVYGDSALLVLNGISLVSVNALLALNCSRIVVGAKFIVPSYENLYKL